MILLSYDKAKGKKVVFVIVVISLLCLGWAAKHSMQAKDGEVTGIVTNKFSDCSGGEEMDKQGNIVPIKEISCDGGSTITIDNKYTFVTSTGNVAPGYEYGVDVSNIKVGEKVVVHYTTSKEGYKDLDCKECGIKHQN